MTKSLTAMTIALIMCSAAPAFADHTPEHKAEQKADVMFDKMDINHDGMVSKAEHDAAGNMMFSEADTNKDGSLSKDEMEAHKKAKMQEMHHEMEMKK